MPYRGGKQRIIIPGNDRAAFMPTAEGPTTDRTADFAELKRNLDVADADIALVNKRLNEAQGMYFRLVNKY